MEIPLEKFVQIQAGAWKEIVTEMIGAPLIQALNGDSFNGPGSSMLYTEELRVWLPRLLRRYQVTSMVDAPCGDLNWIRNTNLSYINRYIGIDVDKRIIEKNKIIMTDRYEFEFYCRNILTFDRIPKVDLILCRDFLAHLTTEAIELVLEKFKKSKTKYLLATNFPDSKNEFEYNPADYPWDGYLERVYDLTKPPFELLRIDGIPEESPPRGVISKHHELSLFELN